MGRFALFFLAGFLLSCSQPPELVAEGLTPEGLFVWKIPNGPQVVFPTVPEKTPEEVVRLYATRLNLHPDYTALSRKIYVVPRGQAHALSERADLPRFLVMANELTTQSHHGGVGDIHLDRVFSQAGGDGYVLPLGLEVLLTPAGLQSFRELLRENFDVLVAGGGADVDPSLYGEENLASSPNSKARDAEEIGHIRFWVEQTNKIFLGICRGQQIGAVALGYTLIQDIPSEVPDLSLTHGGGDHPITLMDDHNPLARMMGDEPLYGRSTHHQAVDFDRERYGVRVIAQTEGIVEAMANEDGRILMVQFHPESTPDPVGSKVIRGMVEHGKSWVGDH